MFVKMDVITVCFLIMMSFVVVSSQIAFPENDEEQITKNRDNRQPIYAPSKCPENELYYPGDQKSDWICDCRPAYLFHPLSDKCHPAYRRGPCAQNEFLLLPADSVMPKCADNPCLQDGYVPWKSKCARLDSTDACPTEAGRALRLGVNPATLQLECQLIRFSTRLGEEEDDQPTFCPLGCRRRINGSCPGSPVTHQS